jgi:hypothetical protein
VIIPGEAPVSAVFSQVGFSRVDEIPVVDALGATVKFGEAMVRLAQVSGLRATKRGYFHAKPPAGRLAELVRFYRLDEFGAGAADDPPEER